MYDPGMSRKRSRSDGGGHDSDELAGEESRLDIDALVESQLTPMVGQLPVSGEDLIKYQNRQLILRLREYRARLARLDKRDRDRCEQRSSYENQFNLVFRYWENIQEQVRLLAVEAGESIKILPQPLNSEHRSPDSYLALVESAVRSQVDDRLSIVVGDKSTALLESLRSLAKIVASVAAASDNMSRLILDHPNHGSNDNIQSHMKMELEKAKSMRASIEQFTIEHLQLKDRLNSLEHELALALSRIADSKVELQDADDLVRRLERKLVRLAEKDRGIQCSDEAASSEGRDTKMLVRSPVDRRRNAEDKEVNSDVGTEIVELKQALQDAVALAEERLETERNLSDRIAEYERQLVDLYDERATLIASVNSYQAERDTILIQLETLKEDLKRCNNQLDEANSRHDAELSDFKSASERAVQDIRSKLQSFASEAEATRRASKDALYFQKKAEAELKSKAFRLDELTKLTDSQQAQLKRLYQRCHSNDAQTSSDTVADPANTHSCKEIAALRVRDCALESELAFGKISAGDANGDKSDDQDRELLLQKCVSLEHQLSTMISLEEFNAQKEINDALGQELDDVCRQFEEVHEQNNRLVEQIKRIEDVNTQLVVHRVRAENQNEILVEQLETCKDLTQAAKTTQAAAQEHARALEVQLLTTEAVITSLKQEFATQSKLLSEHKQTATECSARCLRGEGELDQVKRAASEKIQMLKDKVDIDATLERDLRRSEERRAQVQRRLDSYLSGSGAAADYADLEKELALYKSILKCSVCHDREKNVVITKCYHLFCAPCIEENLKIRHRKCPACGKSFGADDVKSVFLS